MPTTFTLPLTTTPSLGDPSGTDLLLGEDILFTDDLQITADGDFAVVRGEETVRQAIYRRLITRPGEFRVRPEYGVGLPTFVKKGLTPSNLDELRRLVEDNMSAETRIDRLLEVVVQGFTTNDNKPGIRVYIKAELLGSAIAFKPFVFVNT